MNSPYKMTGQQAEERMQLYREIFTAVRLLDAGDLRLSEAMKAENTRPAKWNIAAAMSIGRRTSPVKTVFPERSIRTGYSGPSWSIKKMNCLR